MVGYGRLRVSPGYVGPFPGVDPSPGGPRPGAGEPTSLAKGLLRLYLSTWASNRYQNAIGFPGRASEL